MIKYAKVINNNTKECSVGIGTNTEFYESIGFTKQDVEVAYDGRYYLQGFAPSEPVEELKQKKLEELDNNCKNYIYSKYDVETQLNMSNGLYTAEEQETMKIFITEQRDKCHALIEEINKAETSEAINNIDITFKD